MLQALKVLRAHGIDGSVRVFLYNPIKKGQEICNAKREVFIVDRVFIKEGQLAVVHFREVSNRNTAEQLVGTVFYQEKEQLLDSEYYSSDLIGQTLNIKGTSDTCVIKNVLNYGAGDILELSYRNRSILIPFRREFFSSNRELSIHYDTLRSFDL